MQQTLFTPALEQPAGQGGQCAATGYTDGMKRGMYLKDGNNCRLRGEKALLLEHKGHKGMILVQFDNLDLQEAYGWTEFKKEMFIVSVSGVT